MNRDYLYEAYRIARGESTLILPQREHIAALLEYAEKLKARIDALARSLEQKETV